MLNPLVAVAALAFALIAWEAFRAPLHRRLAMRNVSRRRSEAALVIGGALLGAALVTGSLVVGDTLDASGRRTVHTQLGPVDELVLLPTSEEAASVVDQLSSIDDDRIDGVLSMVGAPASIASGALAEPQAGLFELDFEAASTFGGDAAATGIRGPTPTGNEVVITRDLADAIDAARGDSVTAYLYGDEIALQVREIVDRWGLAGFDPQGDRLTSPNAFVAPGTIAPLAAGAEAATDVSIYAGVIRPDGTVDAGLLAERLTAQLPPDEAAEARARLELVVAPDGRVRMENIDLAPPALAEAVRPDGTVDADAFQASADVHAAHAVPPQHLVVVSNRGGVEDGAALTPRVRGVIEDALPEGSAAQVVPVKQRRLDVARGSGAFFGGIFVSTSSFAIIAGILLLVSIFVMLSEERKGQLGMLRAIGMRRSDLVRGFVIEGAIYAGVASAIGAVAGIGLGMILAKLAAPGLQDGVAELSFRADPASVATGFAAGSLISLATIFFTSLRVSRINIIRAIRDLPDPAPASPRRRAVVLGVVVTLAAVAWFVSSIGAEGAWPGLMAGPPIALAGLVPLIGRLVSRRVAVLVASLATVAWGLFGDRLTGGGFFASGEMTTFVVQGVLVTFAAVAAMSQVQASLQRGLRRVAARRLAVRLGTAYPISRTVRTALTLGMYALVIFTLVFVAALASVFSSQVDQETRDASPAFNLVLDGNAANPPDLERIERAQGVVHAVPVWTGTASFERANAEPEQWTVAGIDEHFLSHGAPALRDRASRFQSDMEAWQALLREPDTIMLPPFFLHVGDQHHAVPGPGDTVRTIDPRTGRTMSHRVVGVLKTDPTELGAVTSIERIRAAAPSTVAPDRVYVHADGTEAEVRRLGAGLQGDLVEFGLEANTIRSLVEAELADTIQFMQLMQGFLALGLIVGVAGLGVVMVRAVRERRQQIGVLRSLGFLPTTVRRAFLAEASFVALEGIVIGAALALATASQMASAGGLGEGASFAVPWAEVGRIVGIAFLASMLATAWPATAAARIPPAQALRATT